jgi:thioredoxin 1
MIQAKSVEEVINLIENSKYLVLDFSATWCGPCKRMGQLIHELMEEDKYKDVVFCKIDVDNDEFESLTQKYKVSGIPHVVFFKNSKQVDSLVGFDKSKFIGNLDKIIS